MPASEQLLDDLAGAVLDGAVIDWAAAESTADGAGKPLVRHLHLVASVAQLHRDIKPTETFPGSLRSRWPAPTSDRWGHLRLLEPVGRGAFGEVFRAWDTRLDREVALKLLPAAKGASPPAASSIIREGRLLAKVRHPSVVTIYGAEQIEDSVGLWMEFVRGQTLEQLIQRRTRFETADVVTIGVELCRAVSAVHAAGLLHRDIKAQNVIREEAGRVVLMDFGAGTELDERAASELTGTPLCIAPEVLAGKPATVQSDIYSLGVLLFHLVTGAYPFQGRTLRDLREAHRRGKRTSIREARPDVRQDLARVIEQAIDPAPDRRHQTAEALGTSLLRLHRRRFPAPLVSAAAALAVLAMAGLAAWALRTDQSLPSVQRPAGLLQAGSSFSAPPPPPRGESVTPPDRDVAVSAVPVAVSPVASVPAPGRTPGIRPSVQVLPITNSSGRASDTWLSATLAEMLLREFRGAEAFRWIPGAVPLAKAQLGQALITQSSLFVRPVVEADIVVSGEFTVAGRPGGEPDGLRLTLKLDGKTGRAAAVTLVEAGSTSDLAGLVARIGTLARSALGVPMLTTAQNAALSASQPANVTAARLYTEGLTRPVSEAMDLMERAVAADARFAPAYIALAEGWFFRSFQKCAFPLPPCPDERRKALSAAAKAVELAAALPLEERKLIGIRSLIIEGGPQRFFGTEAIFRELFDLFPDTLLYGFETARTELRIGRPEEGLAIIDRISQLPGAKDDVVLFQYEATLARLAGNPARAQRALDQVAAIAAEVGDRTLLANARNEQAGVALELREPVRAMALAEEALRIFTEIGASPNLATNARATVIRSLRAQGAVDRARAVTEQMIASAKNLPAASRSTGLRRIAAVLADAGDLAQSREVWEEVTRETAANPPAIARLPLMELGVVLHRLGDLTGARKVFEEVRPFIVDSPVQDRESAARHLMARLSLDQGDMALAREQADRAVKAAIVNEPMVEALIAQARTLRAAGETAAARQALDEAARIPRVGPPPARRAAFDLALLQALFAQDDGNAAESRMRAQWALAVAGLDARPDDEAAAECLLAQAWLADGNLARAKETISRAQRRLNVTEDRLLRLRGGIVGARVDAASGAPDTVAVARRHLDAIARQADDLGAVEISFEARLALGEIEIGTGDANGGRARLTALEREASAKGFLTIAKKAAAAR